MFYHPLSEKKFGKLQKRVRVDKEKNSLQIKLSNIENEDEYNPNMLVLPLTDYKMEIMIQLIG